MAGPPPVQPTHAQPGSEPLAGAVLGGNPVARPGAPGVQPPQVDMDPYGPVPPGFISSLGAQASRYGPSVTGAASSAAGAASSAISTAYRPVNLMGDAAQGAVDTGFERLRQRFAPGVPDPYAREHGMGTGGATTPVLQADAQRMGGLSAFEQHLADQGYTAMQARQMAEQQMFDRLGLGASAPGPQAVRAGFMAGGGPTGPFVSPSGPSPEGQRWAQMDSDHPPDSYMHHAYNFGKWHSSGMKQNVEDFLELRGQAPKIRPTPRTRLFHAAHARGSRG